ncbi:hypothetical protein B0I35DRAFT_478102 [Stachybotrys elegans]|uniref:Copper-fist domain-containing protein n=1 Tax=Stachybotrys elegans TaxID=80388 RepID=A0A8K0SR37_9HYPO|nr:hypothetical protein B0I35DRAFT_478102 [Stachybotrys elegans]
MPLINGVKMACEPCIRGHRSTKCTHADERLMVPVRKPGRPLSSCPHPSSRSCSCAALTAAIPKRQKCGCGSSNPPAATVKAESNDNDSADLTPTSPATKTSTSSFRVQKPANRNPLSRKSSLAPANIDRMDPGQLNVMSSEGQSASTLTPDESGASTPGPLVFNPYDVSHPVFPYAPQPVMFPLFQQPMPSPPVDLNPLKIGTNGTNSSASVSAGSSPGGCCGGGGAKKDSESSVPTSDDEREEKPVSSCCSSRTAPDKTNAPANFDRTGQSGLLSNMMMPQYPRPMMMPNGMYPYYPQPTIFTYPPQYGSYLQPLQPDQWRQFMAMTFGQYNSPEAFGMNGNINAAMNGAMAGAMNGSADGTLNGSLTGMHGNANGANGTMNGGMNHGMNGGMGGLHISAVPMPMFNPEAAGTSHQCGCGDGCQCVGCAAHPYNEATQNYIRSAWNSMTEETGHPKTASVAHHAPACGTSDSNQKARADGPSNDVSPAKHSDGPMSPTIAPSPSDAASGAGDEQTLSPTDFFFVSYSLEGSCSGEMAGCPCGDDCQCIGCVIHSIPDPTEPEPVS